MMILTAAILDGMEPGEIRYDRDVRGLYARCAKDGVKTFYLRYRTVAGVERRQRLGRLGVLTLPDARKFANSLMRDVAHGADPHAKRRAARAGATVDELIGAYEERNLPKRRSARSIKILMRHISAHLGGKKVSDIALADVEALHAAVSRTAPTQANRIVAYVSSLLTLAERLELRPIGTNFCKFVERNPERRRRRYLDPVNEAKTLGDALRKRLYTDQHEAALFIFLLMLTGARKGEIGEARAADRRGDILLVGEHKTVGTMGAKVVHLPKAAVDLLDDPLRRQHGRVGALVGVADPRALWEKVREEVGCEDLRLHDLRHSFASFGLGSGVELSMIGELLAHASVQTTKGYAHLIHKPAQVAVNRIADSVADALGMETT